MQNFVNSLIGHRYPEIASPVSAFQASLRYLAKKLLEYGHEFRVERVKSSG